MNSYQSPSGSIDCMRCIDSYMVYSEEGWASGRCGDCPADATCSTAGVMTAAAATFLIIDQRSATVSSFECSASACLTADFNSSCGQAQSVHYTQVRVQNCCAAGRYPAYSPQWQGIGELHVTEGVNVLCALCLPGHTEVNGSCIPCSSASAGLVCALLLVLLAAVYGLHRLPHDQHGKATVMVLGYFVQQSALFLSPSIFLMGLFNLDLLGGSVAQRSASGVGEVAVGQPGLCPVPMHTDAERIVGALLLQLCVFALPAVIALIQLIAHLTLQHSPNSTQLARMAYTVIFMSDAPGPPRLHRPPSLLLEPLRPSSDFSNAWERGGTAPAESMLSPRMVSPRARAQWTPASTEELSDGDFALAVSTEPRLAYQRTFVRVLLLSYTSVALLTLRFFHTRPVSSFGRRVADYPGLDPASAVYASQLLPLMAVLLLLVLLVPWLLAVFLWWLRRRSASDASDASDASASSDAASAGQEQAAAVDVEVPALTVWKAALLLQLCGMFPRGALVDGFVHQRAASAARRCVRIRTQPDSLHLADAGQSAAAGTPPAAAAIQATPGQRAGEPLPAAAHHPDHAAQRHTQQPRRQ